MIKYAKANPNSEVDKYLKLKYEVDKLEIPEQYQDIDTQGAEQGIQRLKPKRQYIKTKSDNSLNGYLAWRSGDRFPVT